MKNWGSAIVFAIVAGANLLGSAGVAYAQAAPTQTRAAPFQVMETSIDTIHAAYKAGTLTAHQLVQKYLDRIAAYDKQGPKINAIITLNPHALEDADRLDDAYKKSGFVGAMHGIPVLVKDEIDVAGLPTTMGTVVFKDYKPTRDAFVVAQLRIAGAIILGKTTLSEFAIGDTYGSMFGVTRNPYDLERTVGGSSGGSGAALAANFATVALGEETVASIRRPGGWNSLVTMRPTSGLVSRTGMWDGYPTDFATMGPMARNVRDLARLLDAMAAYDPEDPQTALGFGHTQGSYTRYLDRNGLKGARIGILREAIGVATEPDSDDFKKVDDVFEKNIAELKAAGATIVDPIVIPDLKMLLTKRVADTTASDEALRLYLARNPNSPFKNRQDIANSPLLDQSFPANKRTLWTTPYAPTDAAKFGEYLKARTQLMTNILKVMADNRLDAIVHKTVEHQPTLIKDGINPPYVSQKGVPSLNTFLVFVSSMTVPSGFTSDNLPVGITFFGRPYSEPVLLKLGYAYEQATHHRVPPKTTPDLASAPLH
ncbi:MAG TPA: amidase family protein [Micropepsaceae bacterium]|jgi:Asp-tRNA(Asn)/Glu-tRNA(Gln) amidotransferase A subunit family amidase|nr:amidase family protein [Micropepsaceae bacterium]